MAPSNIYALFTLFCLPTLSHTKMRRLVNMYPFARHFGNGNITRLCFILALDLTAKRFSLFSSTDRCQLAHLWFYEMLR